MILSTNIIFHWCFFACTFYLPSSLLWIASITIVTHVHLIYRFHFIKKKIKRNSQKRNRTGFFKMFLALKGEQYRLNFRCHNKEEQSSDGEWKKMRRNKKFTKIAKMRMNRNENEMKPNQTNKENAKYWSAFKIHLSIWKSQIFVSFRYKTFVSLEYIFHISF